MKFVTLNTEDFRKFANKSPYKTFTQTPEIAKLREQNGWTTYYFGVEEDGPSASTGRLIAAAVLVAKPTFLGKSTYICPGGPLMDYENTKLTQFFFKNLQKYIKSHNGYVLHISPNYELIQRDRDGEPVENGFNHEKARKNLINLGFHKTPSDNPKYLFTLNLTGKTPDQLFASFKQNTRNLISRTIRSGITVRELKREELGLFKQITSDTSDRRHFTDRPLSYYEQMYDLFHDRGEVMFLVAEAPDGTPLSVAMFILYGKEVIYLYSGSDEKYMKDYNAQYAIQWRMIKYAAEHKYKTYNFYGIQGLPDSTKPGYGIYRFKKGFTDAETGRVVELIGSYELPINQPFYRLHQILSKLKHH